MSFAFPLAFLLVPLPLLVRLLPPLSAPMGLRVPAHVLAGVAPQRGAGRGVLLAALAWAALVVALAGPQVSRESGMIPASPESRPSGIFSPSCSPWIVWRARRLPARRVPSLRAARLPFRAAR